MVAGWLETGRMTAGDDARDVGADADAAEAVAHMDTGECDERDANVEAVVEADTEAEADADDANNDEAAAGLPRIELPPQVKSRETSSACGDMERHTSQPVRPGDQLRATDGGAEDEDANRADDDDDDNAEEDADDKMRWQARHTVPLPVPPLPLFRIENDDDDGERCCR